MIRGAVNGGGIVCPLVLILADQGQVSSDPGGDFAFRVTVVLMSRTLPSFVVGGEIRPFYGR